MASSTAAEAAGQATRLAAYAWERVWKQQQAASRGIWCLLAAVLCLNAGKNKRLSKGKKGGKKKM